MVERTVFLIAALATIAGFLLEAWRIWKDWKSKTKRKDGKRL